MPRRWETQAAAAAVDTRGYCSTTFAVVAGWLSHTRPVDVVHTGNTPVIKRMPLASGKSECNQVGLTDANTMTGNHMKYSRLANVNWRSAKQRGLQARRLLTSALSIITWQLKDPSDIFSLICLLNLRWSRRMSSDHICAKANGTLYRPEKHFLRTSTFKYNALAQI